MRSKILIFVCISLFAPIMGCAQERSALLIGEIEEWRFENGRMPKVNPPQLDELDKSYESSATDPKKRLTIAAFLAINKVNVEKQLSRLRSTYLDYWNWATGADLGKTTADDIFYLPGLLKDIYNATDSEDAFCLLIEMQLDASAAAAQTSALNELILANPSTMLAITPIPDKTLRDLLLVMPAGERKQLKKALTSLPSKGLAHHNARRMLALLDNLEQDRGGLGLDE